MAKTLGLHAASDRLDMAMVQTTGAKAEALAAFSAPWPKPLAAEHAAELGAWLKKQCADRGMAGDVAVSLGRGLAACRTAQVPDSPAEELPGMVRFAAEGQGDAGDDVLDFHAGGLRGGQRDVTLATASPATVAALQAVLRAAGLRLARIEPRAYSLRWLRERLVEGDAGRTELLVATTGAGGEASVWTGGRLDLQRPLPGSSGEASARLAGELRRTIVAFEALDGPKLQGLAVLAAEDSPLLPAARSLGALAVIHADPARKIAGLAEQKAELSAVGAAWRLAAGAATPIDFSRPKKPVVNNAGRLRLALLGSALAGAALFAAYLHAQRGLQDLGAEAGELSRQIAEVKKKVDDGKPLRQRHEAVKGWVAGQIDWLKELSDLSRILPDTQDAIVSRLSADTTAGNSKITFTLLAARAEPVDFAVAELGEAPRYSVNGISTKPLNESNKVFKSEETIELALVAATASKADPKAKPADPKAAAAAAPKKHDEGLAKAGRRRVAGSFGQPQNVVAAAPAAAATKRDTPPRGTPAPAGGTSSAAAETASEPAAADSPEAALAAKVKRLAAMSYEDRASEIAKEKPIFQRALKRKIEEFLEKEKK